MKRERRYYKWLPVIAWMIVIFILSAQPADQSIVLSGSVTRFFADALNQLSAFIEYFTRAQGTVVFMAGILLLIYLLETLEDEPRIFGIKKRWIIGGTAIFLVLAIGLFLFVDFVQDTSITYAGRLMRKSAHFIAYLILGFLVSHAMKNEDSTAPAWKRRGVSLLLCVAYAISDEVPSNIRARPWPAAEGCLHRRIGRSPRYHSLRWGQESCGCSGRNK